MSLLLAGLGMLGCLAIMLVLMPLGMRVAHRVRRATANHAADSTASGSRDAHRPSTLQAPTTRSETRRTAVWTRLGPPLTARSSDVGCG